MACKSYVNETKTMQALESYPGYSGWLPGGTSLQCRGSPSLTCRRAILNLLRRLTFLCTLEQTKNEQWTKDIAAWALAIEQAVAANRLELNALLETFETPNRAITKSTQFKLA